MTWQMILSVAGALGGGGTIVALLTIGPMIRKARAEAKRAEVDVSLTEDAAGDTHWKNVIEAFESLVQPLREEVSRLQQRVENLEQEVTRHRTRYWRAIEYIRTLLGVLGQHASHSVAPDAPAEIAADI